jgi:hypothetical protein
LGRIVGQSRQEERDEKQRKRKDMWHDELL